MRRFAMMMAGLCLRGGLAGSNASAQVVDPLNGKGALPPAAGRFSTESLTTYVKIEIAPTIAGLVPFRRGDSLSELNTTTGAIGADYVFRVKGFASPWKLSASGGVKSNRDPKDIGTSVESAFVFDARLLYARGVGELSPFVSYGFERAYFDLIEDHAYTDHRFAVGARYKVVQWGENTLALNIVPALERAFSSDPARQRWSPKLGAELNGGFANGIEWFVQAVGEYRIFDRGLGRRRKDARAIVYANLDAAKGLGLSGVKEAKLGVRWIRTESNIAADSSRYNLLPVLTLIYRFD